MRFLKWVGIFFLVIQLACTKKASDDKNPIRIGHFGSFTGNESTFGLQTHKGIMLAVEEINKAGGVKGRKIEIIAKDNESRTENVIPQVTELIEVNRVMVLIGDVNSARSLAAGPVAQAAQIPMVSTSSTNPKVTKIGDYIFRVCFIDPFQGFVMAKFALENLKLKKVAVLFESTSEYSKGLAENFSDTFKKMGGQILAEDSYKSGDVDFKKQLVKIREEKPEALFLPGYYTEVALIARQAKQLGIKVQLIGGDGWNSPRLYELGRDAIDGGFFSHHFVAESREPSVVDFIKKYREKFNEVPDGLAALGYDAVKVIAAAMARTDSLTPEQIRNQLTKTKDFPGTSGKITLNEQRDAVKSAVVVRVDGPTFRYVTTVHP